MKLLELIEGLEDYTRIKRSKWNFFIVRPQCSSDPLIKLNLWSIQIERYMLTFDDLLASDWEILK